MLSNVVQVLGAVVSAGWPDPDMAPLSAWWRSAWFRGAMPPTGPGCAIPQVCLRGPVMRVLYLSWGSVPPGLCWHWERGADPFLIMPASIHPWNTSPSSPSAMQVASQDFRKLRIGFPVTVKQGRAIWERSIPNLLFEPEPLNHLTKDRQVP